MKDVYKGVNYDWNELYFLFNTQSNLIYYIKSIYEEVGYYSSHFDSISTSEWNTSTYVETEHIFIVMAGTE